MSSIVVYREAESILVFSLAMRRQVSYADVCFVSFVSFVLCVCVCVFPQCCCLLLLFVVVVVVVSVLFLTYVMS